MKSVYAVRLSLYVPARVSIQRHHWNVVETCHTWLAQEAGKHGGSGFDGSFREPVTVRGTADECTGDTVLSELDGEYGWRATLIVPELAEPDTLTRYDLQAFSSGSETTFTMRIQTGSRSDRLVPRRAVVRAPSLVPDLVVKFGTTVGNRIIGADPPMIHVQDVDELVEDLLRDDRLLPVVVISAPENGTFLIDPFQLGQALFGFARLALLADRTASDRLSELLSPHLTAHSGAVRLYWPHFSLGRDRQHYQQVWLPELLDDPTFGPEFPALLFHTIADTAAMRIGLDRRIGELERESARIERERVEHERQEEVKEQLLRLRRRFGEPASPTGTSGNTAELLAEVEALIQLQQDGIEQSLDQLQRENDEMKAAFDGQLEELSKTSASDENARSDALQAQFAAEAKASAAEAKAAELQGRLDALSVESPLDHFIEGAAVETLEALVRGVKERTHPSEVVFLDSALRTAKASQYDKLARAARELKAIVTVSRWYRDGKMPDGFHDAFVRAGATGYATTISLTAKNQHGREYEHVYDDGSGPRKYRFEAHLKVGGGSPNFGLRIHFIEDRTNDVLVVGHIGVHLSGKKAT